MKIKIKKAVLLVMTAVMVIAQCTYPVLAYEPQTVVFSSESKTVKKGESFTIPIRISSEDESNIELGGLVFSLYYSPDCLTYSEGSEQSLVNSAMKDALVYHNASKNKITFAWTSTDAVKVKNDNVLFNATFSVLHTAGAEADVKLVIEQAYTYDNNDGVEIYDLNVETKEILVDIVVSSEDSSVKQVEDLIAAIGTVSYSQESLNKILAAASAYAILTEPQKKQVSNYTVLSEAMVEYERLRIVAEDSEISAEISAYMSKHITALALTTDTVTLEDEERVNAAIQAFDEELSVDAQSRIYSERRELKNVLAQIEQLKKDEAAKEAAAAREAQLRKKAQEYAAAFRADYATFLTLKVEDLVAEHYTGLNAAVAQLNMLIGLNPYVEEYLKAEKIIITSLYEAVQDLMNAGDTSTEEGISNAQMSADNFRTNFAYVLSLTPDTVTADDLVELRVAEAMYYELDAETQGLLTEEFAIITELLSVIDELPGTSSEYVTVVNSGLDRLTVRFANRQMGAITWILLLLFLLSVIVFVVLQLFYHFYIKARPKLLKESIEEKGGDL